MIELVLATNNESKIKEYRSILEPYGIEIKTLKEVGVESDPIENGKSYEENAMIKVRAVLDILKVSGYLDTSGYLAGDHAKFEGCWPYELFTVNIDSPIRTLSDYLSDYDASFRNAVSHRGLAGAYMAKYILSENNAEEHHKMTHEEMLGAIDEASNILKNASNEILQVERIINKIKVENGGTKNDR